MAGYYIEFSNKSNDNHLVDSRHVNMRFCQEQNSTQKIDPETSKRILKHMMFKTCIHYFVFMYLATFHSMILLRKVSMQHHTTREYAVYAMRQTPFCVSVVNIPQVRTHLVHGIGFIHVCSLLMPQYNMFFCASKRGSNYRALGIIIPLLRIINHHHHHHHHHRHHPRRRPHHHHRRCRRRPRPRPRPHHHQHHHHHPSSIIHHHQYHHHHHPSSIIHHHHHRHRHRHRHHHHHHHHHHHPSSIIHHPSSIIIIIVIVIIIIIIHHPSSIIHHSSI